MQIPPLPPKLGYPMGEVVADGKGGYMSHVEYQKMLREHEAVLKYQAQQRGENK